MSDKKPPHQISMAASAIALRGVHIFLNASKAAADKRAQPRARAKRPLPGYKMQTGVLDVLLKVTKFDKNNRLKNKIQEKAAEID